MKTHQDYTDDYAKIDAFDPNQQTVSFAVWFPGQRDMALYNKKGPANASITSAYPGRVGVLYENRNGMYVEIDRAPIPECSFCHEIVRAGYSFHREVLIKQTPMYKSALVCDQCRADGRVTQGAVDQIKWEKGL